MEKRKVLILCNKLTGGGVEKVMQDVANYLAKKSDLYDVTVTTLEGPDEGRDLLSKNITIKGIFRSKAAYKKWSLPWVWFKVRQLFYCIYLTLGKYDIVLTIKDGWYIKLGAHMKANRKIAWVHTAALNSDWASAFFKSPEEERNCMAAFSRVICVSECKRELVIDYSGDPGNLVVCYNPLNVEEILKRSNEEIELPSERTHPIFIAVNRLSAEKENIRLLECVKQLGKDYDFSLWIVGDGEERDNLEKYIQDNNLTNVTLLGWQSNPYPFMKAADWFVSASTCETYGLTLQEANILEKPGLIATLSVFEECADHKKNLLVDNSVEGLLDGMRAILDGTVKIDVSNDPVELQKIMYDDRFEKIERTMLG